MQVFRCQNKPTNGGKEIDKMKCTLKDYNTKQGEKKMTKKIYQLNDRQIAVLKDYQEWCKENKPWSECFWFDYLQAKDFDFYLATIDLGSPQFDRGIYENLDTAIAQGYVTFM